MSRPRGVVHPSFGNGALLGLLITVVLSGCLPHERQTEIRTPFDLPEQYEQAEGLDATTPPGIDAQALGEQGPPTPDRWWEALGDPELNHLVDQALSRNLQLGAAWARLDQARAGASGASAGLWPQISAQLDVSRRRQVVVFGALGRQEFENNGFSLSVPVSYEIDLWNRVGAQVAAAGLDVMAGRDDVESLAMTLAANVVEAWLNLVQQRAMARLVEEQLETNRLYEELTVLRFSHGLGSALEVYQQRQQVQALEAQQEQVEGGELLARQQLAALLGQPPSAMGAQFGSLPEPTALPSVPALPSTGVPADLLSRRPDVRSARRRAEAADWRLGAAIAEQFPSIRLQGAPGLSSPTVQDFLSSFVYSVLGSVMTSVLDGGRRAAEVARNRAVLRERTLTFGQTLLTAMVEVESALVQERQQRALMRGLRAQLSTARSALHEARRRYTAGLSEYLPVLTALGGTQRLEQSLLQTQRQVLSNRIQLARALGGAWTVELEASHMNPSPEPSASETNSPSSEQPPPQTQPLPQGHQGTASETAQ